MELLASKRNVIHLTDHGSRPCWKSTYATVGHWNVKLPSAPYVACHITLFPTLIWTIGLYSVENMTWSHTVMWKLAEAFLSPIYTPLFLGVPSHVVWGRTQVYLHLFSTVEI